MILTQIKVLELPVSTQDQVSVPMYTAMAILQAALMPHLSGGMQQQEPAVPVTQQHRIRQPTVHMTFIQMQVQEITTVQYVMMARLQEMRQQQYLTQQ